MLAPEKLAKNVPWKRVKKVGKLQLVRKNRLKPELQRKKR
jgi:sporulation protein YlmC with PRC-barrel domain